MPGSSLGIEGPDIVTIFARAGKGVGRIFKSKRSDSTPEPAVNVDHGFSYGVVYANDLAVPEIMKSAPKFPVGSMIVRERLTEPTSTVPTAVIAMLKRESGFSKTTGDWEFFMMNGSDMKLFSRQTTGSCSACHTQAKKTDWVFVDELKR